MDVLKLAEEIVNGRRLGGEDDLMAFVTCDLDDLCRGADVIREKLCGDKVDLCTIINGKSGRCGEDCKYCAQSAHHHTACEEYGFLDSSVIMDAARANEEEGVDRFAIVTSGKALTGEEFDRAIDTFSQMNEELKIDLCASLGFLNRDQFKRLRQAGVTSYHDNIETSRRYFPQICSTHSFDEKLATIRMAQEEGFCVCSGGIIGMGETWEDRISMALTLSELGIRSIPVNVLMAIPGTPLEGMQRLEEDEILRAIAIFRYINPEANIRLAGGRMLMANDGRQAFCSGASATITGNMLTTSGSTIRSDKEMLKEMGRNVEPQYNTNCGCH
ncbi:MAG: biotin synthase BioB [Eubacterium sp.]|nr:biotin synthase BioB [Eubacterium sp.]